MLPGVSDYGPRIAFLHYDCQDVMFIWWHSRQRSGRVSRLAWRESTRCRAARSDRERTNRAPLGSQGCESPELLLVMFRFASAMRRLCIAARSGLMGSRLARRMIGWRCRGMRSSGRRTISLRWRGMGSRSRRTIGLARRRRGMVGTRRSRMIGAGRRWMVGGGRRWMVTAAWRRMIRSTRRGAIGRGRGMGEGGRLRGHRGMESARNARAGVLEDAAVGSAEIAAVDHRGAA